MVLVPFGGSLLTGTEMPEIAARLLESLITLSVSRLLSSGGFAAKASAASGSPAARASR